MPYGLARRNEGAKVVSYHDVMDPLLEPEDMEES